MFERHRPTHKIGCLQPGTLIDNHPFEFYRLAPPGIMLVMIGVGLAEFSRGDVERVFEPLDQYLDQALMDRRRRPDHPERWRCTLPIRIGLDAHDRMIEHMAGYTGLPATSTVLSVVKAAGDLGLRKVAVVNKWTAEMNASLAAFFARGGVSVVGGATKSLDPAEFHRDRGGRPHAACLRAGPPCFHRAPGLRCRVYRWRVLDCRAGRGPSRGRVRPAGSVQPVGRHPKHLQDARHLAADQRPQPGPCGCLIGRSHKRKGPASAGPSA